MSVSSKFANKGLNSGKDFSRGKQERHWLDKGGGNGITPFGSASRSGDEARSGRVVGRLHAHLFVTDALQGHMVEVDLAIYHKQRVGLRHHVLVDADAVQELLQDGAQLQALLVEPALFLINSEVVQLDLVETLEESVKVSPLIDAIITH